MKAWFEMGRPDPPSREQAPLRHAATKTKEETGTPDNDCNLLIERILEPSPSSAWHRPIRCLERAVTLPDDSEVKKIIDMDETTYSVFSWALPAIGLLLVAIGSINWSVPLSGWRPHHIREGDGQGGWILRPAEYQLLHHPQGANTAVFGLAKMDNGQIILMGIWCPGDGEKTVRSFSHDDGDTWDEIEVIPGLEGRPLLLADLGNGRLTFHTETTGRYLRCFSEDYGRTWESTAAQPAANGQPWSGEGNPLVDRGVDGTSVRLAEIGWNFAPGEVEGWPQTPTKSRIRWSSDGGRTWEGELQPDAWLREETYEGKTYLRGTGEGSLVRAANGWLVAALRTNIPPCYFGKEDSDQYMGTAVSISKDDGRTWSPHKVLFPAGRMHAHLLAMANGDLVMTVTVRHDLAADGGYASCRRGCEAVISRDHGLTWDLERRFVLDDWQFGDPGRPGTGDCGHLYATGLDDRTILTAHNNYLTKGISLIRWQIG